MEPLRRRYLTYLDERAAPEPRPLRPLATAVFALCVSAALLLAVAFPYHHLIAAPLMPLGALWLFQGVDGTLQRRRERHRRAEARRIALHGVPVTAWAVEKPRRGWCRALVSFDPAAGGNEAWMRHLAMRYRPFLPRRARLVRSRRLPLPLTLTDGDAVYLVDLEVPPDYLDGPTEALPCLAEPGETGGIALLPCWLVFPVRGESAPTRRSQRV